MAILGIDRRDTLIEFGQVLLSAAEHEGHQRGEILDEAGDQKILNTPLRATMIIVISKPNISIIKKYHHLNNCSVQEQSPKICCLHLSLWAIAVCGRTGPLCNTPEVKIILV